MIRILVVDRHLSFRQALASLLDKQPDLEVVGSEGSLAEALTSLEDADVLLLHRGLPDGDGFELIVPLRAVNPNARVFMISSAPETIDPRELSEAKVNGVIDKFDTPDGVLAAIREPVGG